jgi:hypothetical protein
MGDDFINNILQLSLKEIFMFVLSPFLIAVYSIVKNQFLKNQFMSELKNSEKIRSLLISLSMRLHFLESTTAIVLRRHNGGIWANGKSMQRFSIYESLSINHNLTEFSSYLENCNMSKFHPIISPSVLVDVISLDEIKSFFLYDFLKKEGVKYLIVSKISNINKLNGLLIILLHDSPNYNKSEFNKIKLISEEIGKYFK